MSVRVDADALLCALVLAPRTFARNRFFSLYTQVAAKHARSRAAEMRSMVRHLSGHKGVRAIVREVGPGEGGSFVLRYGVPGIRMERTAVLDSLELSLLRFALGRATANCAQHCSQRELEVTDDDRAAVLRAVSKLDDRFGHLPEYRLGPGSD
jgi:hypothetical protein